MDIRRLKISNTKLSLVRLLTVALFLCLTFQFQAQAKTALDLGVIGMGARPLSMGKAFVAVADDSNAIFTNPAGLASQKSWSATCMSAKLMDRVNYQLVAGTYRTEHGTVGLGYIAATTPGGYLTTNKSSLTGASPISYGSSQIILSYGRNLNEVVKQSSPLGNLSFGVNYKLLTNSFSGYNGSASGSSIDAGILLKPRENLQLGAKVSNMTGELKWSNGSSENLESTIKLGAATRLMDKKLLVAGEVDLPIGQEIPTLVHVGLEWEPNKYIAIRGGLNQDPLGASSTVTNLTGGIGVKLAGFSFDYAYLQDSKLAGNSTHFISLSFHPGIQKTKIVEKSKEITEVTKQIKSEPHTEKISKSEFGILSYFK